MTFKTSRQTDSVERVAEAIDTTLSSMLDQLQAWRVRINTNSQSTGDEAEANYQRLTSARTFIAAKVAANPTGIASAYQRRFEGLEGFDPAAEWATSKAAIDTFVTWFQANWPKTAGGLPAFEEYGPTGELRANTVPLTGATKTNVLAQIDAVLATFS